MGGAGEASSRDLGGWTMAQPPGKAYPKEESTVSQARLGPLSWPVGPWHAAMPIRKSRSHSVCFPAGVTSLFPLLCSIHGAGSRTGLAGWPAGILCHRPGAHKAPALASASGVARVPGPELQNHADKTSWLVGGHLGWEDRVTLGEGFQTVSFRIERHCPYLLSCQAGTPH